MKYLFSILIPMFFHLANHAQVSVVKVLKGEMAHLKIKIHKGDCKLFFSAGDCTFKEVTRLPDSTKLRLIADVFDFLDDANTRSYQPIRLFPQEYTMFTRRPESKFYNLQIDGLALINFLAFSSEAFRYSPYPLLFNKDTGREINNAGKELTNIVDRYKMWFSKLRETGFHSYSFPDLGSNNTWFDSKYNSKFVFNEYPVWDEYWDCKELKIDWFYF